MLLSSEGSSGVNSWCHAVPCRILESLGAEVRVFNPAGLPVQDETSNTHPKVVELRDLSIWSEAQVTNLPAHD
jgi:hypothetical protein